MFHHSQKNDISFTDEFSTPRLRHQIDALCRAAREDDFVCASSADVLRDALPRVFVRFSRAPTQSVQAAMDICVIVFVEILDRFDYRPRLLRGRCTIKINQRVPARLLAEDRKILAKSL